jgi:LacI family repressor for deo operon, udp, cdd, tsx, nupC, and nupG
MAAYQAGHMVPRDVSIVGFDDIPLANGCWPALTTLRKPIRQMAEKVVTSLIGLIENGTGAGTRPPPDVVGIEEPHREYLFAPELVIRGSTGRPDEQGQR